MIILINIIKRIGGRGQVVKAMGCDLIIRRFKSGRSPFQIF